MSKAKGVFDDAIEAIKCVVDFSAAPNNVVNSCKSAIRVLRACEKVEVLTTRKGYGCDMTGRREYMGETKDIHILNTGTIARAILAARRRAERDARKEGL